MSLGADPTDLAGVDLIETRAAAARRKMPGAQIATGSAEKLPWPDESFDLVTQFVVFTSILDRAMKQTVAREMMRITKTGGLILWYDFRYNNPRNANVLGVGAREIRDLFSGCRLKLWKVTLAPPLARAIVPISWTGALLLEKIPWLRTHHFAVIRKPAPPTSVL